MLPPAHEIATVLAQSPVEDVGVSHDKVRRRKHVKHLAGGEFQHALMLNRYAGHAGRRHMPPLLGQQMRLDKYAKGHLPHAGEEKRLSCGSGSTQGAMPGGSSAQRAANCCKRIHIAPRFLGKLKPLAGEAARCVAQSR